MATQPTQASSRRPLPLAGWIVRYPAAGGLPERFIYAPLSHALTTDRRMAHRFTSSNNAYCSARDSHMHGRNFAADLLTGDLVIEQYDQPDLFSQPNNSTAGADTKCGRYVTPTLSLMGETF